MMPAYACVYEYICVNVCQCAPVVSACCVCVSSVQACPWECACAVSVCTSVNTCGKVESLLALVPLLFLLVSREQFD